jgi:hypothetical protein
MSDEKRCDFDWGHYEPSFLSKGEADALFEMAKAQPRYRPIIKRSGYHLRRCASTCWSVRDRNDDAVGMVPLEDAVMPASACSGALRRVLMLPRAHPPSGGPTPGAQVGAADDNYEVYQGGAYNVDGMSGAPIWRYSAKNALNTPDVPAVEQFRKAIEEAEKQATKRKKQP